ncbi:MAG: flagellar biosynthesis anti-sigma factor FlgM, partial [Deltaproteobacteria bacterium]
MKIDEIYRNLSLVQNSPESQNVKQSKQELTAVDQVSDQKQQDTKVEISDISMAFKTVKEVMDKDDPERVAKVRAVKEAIQQGTYAVDSGSVAEKILKDALSILVE